MLAYLLELEANSGARMVGWSRRDRFVLGEERGWRQTFHRRDIAVDLYVRTTLITENVLFPGDLGTTIGTKEVILIRREVREAELIVVTCKP